MGTAECGCWRAGLAKCLVEVGKLLPADSASAAQCRWGWGHYAWWSHRWVRVTSLNVYERNSVLHLARHSADSHVLVLINTAEVGRAVWHACLAAGPPAPCAHTAACWLRGDTGKFSSTGHRCPMALGA